jgi:hypothetical protein
LESLPCDSIELVNRANEDNRCVSCVCVFAFDLCVMFTVFFMFILVPRHKSRESVKIGPQGVTPYHMVSAAFGCHGFTLVCDFHHKF